MCAMRTASLLPPVASSTLSRCLRHSLAIRSLGNSFTPSPGRAASAGPELDDDAAHAMSFFSRLRTSRWMLNRGYPALRAPSTSASLRMIATKCPHWGSETLTACKREYG